MIPELSILLTLTLLIRNILLTTQTPPLTELSLSRKCSLPSSVLDKLRVTTKLLILTMLMLMLKTGKELMTKKYLTLKLLFLRNLTSILDQTSLNRLLKLVRLSRDPKNLMITLILA